MSTDRTSTIMRKRSEEFLKLKAWGETILTFLSDIPYYTLEAKEWRNIFNECDKWPMISMRLFIGDTNEMLRDNLDQQNLIKLNRILLEKFGEDLISGMAKRMAGVLKRGKIRTDDEFVRVNEWIDHLLYDKDNPDAEQQIEQYNQLLLDYQERAARRLGKSNPS